MKVEYITPFVESACSVLEYVSGTPVKVGDLCLLGNPFGARNINIAARVEGALFGNVVYSMPSLTARRLASRIIGKQCQGVGRVMGIGLTELGTKFVRAASSTLAKNGYRCGLSSPTVFHGLNVEFMSESPALSIPLETDAGEMNVIVAVRGDE
ncbi:MAG: chemotaxis protein CheX [Armatimonadota bacterium]|nr:chemotaxis protein CheX [Armatimonadota bacterium]